MDMSVYGHDLPARDPGWSALHLLNMESLAASFLNDTDYRNVALQGRVKALHTVGVSAPVDFVVTGDSGYTGVFRSGGVGILRLSLGRNKENPFTPGLALKVLIDGRPSVNFHAMYSLDGQGSDINFFEHTFTNRLGKPDGLVVKALGALFHAALPHVSDDPRGRPADARTLPLVDSASVESDGTLVDAPRAPDTLLVVPQANPMFVTGTDFHHTIMQHLNPGDDVYKVVAVNNEQERQVVGVIRLRDRFTASRHGDDMFFQHQRFSGQWATCPFMSSVHSKQEE
eukprot:jgi/Chrzof1/6325/Cz18g04100.t1